VASNTQPKPDRFGDIERALLALDKSALKSKSAGADAKAVAKLVAGPLPAELVAFWAWGRIVAVCGASALESQRLESEHFWFTQEWLSPSEVARSLRELRASAKFPLSLVPIATDEAGNFTCFDMAKSALVDWDHETCKAKSLRITLDGVLERVQRALADAEKSNAKPAAKAPAAKAPAAKAPAAKAPAKAATAPVSADALPSKLAQASVAVLRTTDFLGHDAIEDAIMSPDGKQLVARRRGRATYFIDPAAPKPICPRVAELEAAFASRGYVTDPPTEALAADAVEPFFATQSGCNLHVWTWVDERPEIVAEARWGSPDATESTVQVEGERFGGRLRLAAGWLGLAASSAIPGKKDEYDSPVFGSPFVALWLVADLPETKRLSKSVKEREPDRRIAEGMPGLQAFDIGADERVITVHETAFQKHVVTLWDAAKGKSLRQAKLNGRLSASRVELSPDGTRAAVHLHDALILLDDQLATVCKLEKNDAPKSVRFAPSGAFFATTTKDEVCLWNARDGRPLGRVKVNKGKRKDATPEVEAIAGARLLTSEPFALFDLKD
jgi:hypothetical protein